MDPKVYKRLTKSEIVIAPSSVITTSACFLEIVLTGLSGFRTTSDLALRPFGMLKERGGEGAFISFRATM